MRAGPAPCAGGRAGTPVRRVRVPAGRGSTGKPHGFLLRSVRPPVPGAGPGAGHTRLVHPPGCVPVPVHDRHPPGRGRPAAASGPSGGWKGLRHPGGGGDSGGSGGFGRPGGRAGTGGRNPSLHPRAAASPLWRSPPRPSFRRNFPTWRAWTSWPSGWKSPRPT